MVEYNIDYIFRSLADPTRRDILRRAYQSELSISELAAEYDMSFTAVAKHLNVLEKAKLIFKQKQGRQQLIIVNPTSIEEAARQIEEYKRFYNERFDTLDALLRKEE